MSFSFYKTGLADEVRAAVKAAQPTEVPKCLQEFVLIGINGLKDHFGPQVEVDVALHGHLCSDKSSYEASGIDLHIRKKSVISKIGDEIEKVEGAMSDSGAADTDPLPPAEPTVAEAVQGGSPVTLADIPHNDPATPPTPAAEPPTPAEPPKAE